jgi:hypothetical protein
MSQIVLGILLRAKLTGQIPTVKPEIHAFRDKARFFIAPPLETRILALAGD